MNLNNVPIGERNAWHGSEVMALRRNIKLLLNLHINTLTLDEEIFSVFLTYTCQAMAVKEKLEYQLTCTSNTSRTGINEKIT